MVRIKNNNKRSIRKASRPIKPELEDIRTNSEWEEMMSIIAVKLIQTYQKWTGPNESIKEYIITLKNSLENGDYFHFFTACVDEIEVLRNYRRKCRPVFLLYVARTLVKIFEEIDIPTIETAVETELKKELKSLKVKEKQRRLTVGKEQTLPLKPKSTSTAATVAPADDQLQERKHVFSVEDSESTEVLLIEKGERIDKTHWVTNEKIQVMPTYIIIKPDIVENGKQQKIMHLLQADASVTILLKETHVFSMSEINLIFGDKMDKDELKMFAEHLTKGRCIIVLAMTGKTGMNGYAYFNDLAGPSDPDEARMIKPNSIRALYGTDKIKNAVDVSENQETAMRLVRSIFPKYVLPSIKGGIDYGDFIPYERTLAIIRPSTVIRYRDEILKRIEDAGFAILFKKEYNIRQDEARKFYSKLRNKYFYEQLLEEMTCASSLILCLSKENAIEDFRQLLGPTKPDHIREAPGTLRHDFADPDSIINCMHGSATEEAAETEIEFFFPVQKTLAIIKPGYVQNTVTAVNKIIKQEYFSILVKEERQLTEEVINKIYAAHQQDPWFKAYKEYMCGSKSILMVLLREDAVFAWRELIGPTNPAVAKIDAPNTIRAKFGTNLMMNAVHGSSNYTKAREDISILFPDRKFQPLKNIKEIYSDDALKRKEYENSRIIQFAENAYLALIPAVTYKIYVHTYYKFIMEKDLNIYLVFEGTEGVTRRLLLNQTLSGKIPFLTGSIDVFEVKANFVGALKKVIILTDDTNLPQDWFVKTIEAYIYEKLVGYIFTIDGFIDSSKNIDSYTRVIATTIKKKPEGDIAIILQTGSRKYAGTQAAVALTFVSKDKTQIQFSLNRSLLDVKDSFQTGQRSIFLVELPFGLDDVESLILSEYSVRKSPAWFVSFITLLDTRTRKSRYFPVNRWLSENYADGKTEITLHENVAPGYDENEVRARDEQLSCYEIITMTGMNSNASTDSSIEVELIGDAGSIKRYIEIAENTEQPFECGSTDYFLIHGNNIGKLKTAIISYDAENFGCGWFIERIQIRMPSGEIHDFIIKKWIDIHLGGSDSIKIEVDTNKVIAMNRNNQGYKAEKEMFSSVLNRRQSVYMSKIMCQYEFQIVTENVRKCNGFPKVTVEIIGREQNSGDIELVSSLGYNFLESDGMCVMCATTAQKVFNVEKLKVFIETGGYKCGWKPESITVSIPALKETYFFQGGRWLDSEEENGSLLTYLKACKIPYTNFNKFT